ncbi:MAG TPA: carbohydrate porin, partial [Rhizomicrobium sp.]
MKKNAGGGRGMGTAGMLPVLAMAGLVAAAPAFGQAEAGAQGTDVWTQDTLTGDWGGGRSRLADSGITLGLAEISEVLGNVSGGQKQAGTYMGRTELVVDLDLDKLVGWKGATIHVNGFQIHGR